MASTLLSTIIQKASTPAHSEIDVLEIVKYELREVSRLLSRLKPSVELVYSEWQPKIAKQLKDFVDVVVACRLASLRKQPPVLTGLTTEQERKLKYAFEAMQEERHVPLIRYGIVPDPPMQPTLSTSSENLDGELPAVDDDVLDQQEEAEGLYTPQQLRTELRVVRTQNMQLSRENSSLIKVNEQLAKKVLSLSRTNVELDSKNIEVPFVTVTTATPSGPATPAPACRVLSKSSRRLPPTPPSIFKRMTTLGDKDKNFFGHRRFNSDLPSKLKNNFFSSPLAQSPENDDVFKAINDKPLPLLLINTATQDTVKLPRNVGSNNLKHKASGILPVGDRLIRNNGMVDLQTAAVLECHQPPTVAKALSQRSTSNNDQKATGTSPEQERGRRPRQVSA
jgi:hypothetical protein